MRGVTMVVTCRTDGCGNAGIEIELLTDPDNPPAAVLCGACGQEITEVRQS